MLVSSAAVILPARSFSCSVRTADLAENPTPNLPQIVFQFIPQVFAVFAIRMYRKEIHRPYGMRLYPVPAIVALIGWIYVAATPDQRQYLGTALILFLLGLCAYLLRAKVIKWWPFGSTQENRSARAR